MQTSQFPGYAAAFGDYFSGISKTEKINLTDIGVLYYMGWQKRGKVSPRTPSRHRKE